MELLFFLTFGQFLENIALLAGLKGLKGFFHPDGWSYAERWKKKKY